MIAYEHFLPYSFVRHNSLWKKLYELSVVSIKYMPNSTTPLNFITHEGNTYSVEVFKYKYLWSILEMAYHEGGRTVSISELKELEKNFKESCRERLITILNKQHDKYDYLEYLTIRDVSLFYSLPKDVEKHYLKLAIMKELETYMY